MNIDDIKTITVLGAGDMGHGIAEVALMSGFKVYLYDINQEFVDKGVSRILKSLEKFVSKGKVTNERFESIKSSLLVPVWDLEKAVRETDLVIEAIPEKLELKKQVFSKIDKFAPPHTLFASNTSTMSISEIATVTSRPDKFIGLHYFNPAVLMKLVEVIKGDQASEESMQIGFEFVNRCGKVPVRVNKDVAGFIVNRVQAPGIALLNCILDRQVASPSSVDAAFRQTGVPMGPYEVMDYTGLDINYHACAYFAETVHPDFALGATLKAKFDAGELGKKTGKGIFDWSNGRPRIELSEATTAVDPIEFAIVNANEAAGLVEQGVCSFADVDVAIQNATGNPSGYISLVRSIPPDELCKNLERLATQFDKEIFRPKNLIKDGSYQRS